MPIICFKGEEKINKKKLDCIDPNTQVVAWGSSSILNVRVWGA